MTADLSAEPRSPQPVPPESQTMTKLAETVSALSERVAIVEARLAPKPRRGNAGACRTGWRPGRHRFGFRPHAKVPGRLVEDFDEQAAIRLILQARTEGMGPRSICTHLDNLHVQRRGKRWKGAHSLVRSVLQRAR